MKQYRITKYDPQQRNDLGHYVVDEWTSIYDMGRKFNGVVFSEEDYLITETMYINAIIQFMICSSTDELKLSDVNHYYERDSDFEEHCKNFRELYSASTMRVFPKIKNRSSFALPEITDICRLILREDVWGTLKSKTMFVHFGYDYYMYIGVNDNCNCERAIEEIEKSGLFVEEFESPYSKSGVLKRIKEKIEALKSCRK
jgi:hypothetical protein